MHPTYKKKLFLYIALILLGMAVIYIFSLEDDSSIKATIRSIIRAIIRAF